MAAVPKHIMARSQSDSPPFSGNLFDASYQPRLSQSYHSTPRNMTSFGYDNNMPPSAPLYQPDYASTGFMFNAADSFQWDQTGSSYNPGVQLDTSTSHDPYGQNAYGSGYQAQPTWNTQPSSSNSISSSSYGSSDYGPEEFQYAQPYFPQSSSSAMQPLSLSTFASEPRQLSPHMRSLPPSPQTPSHMGLSPSPGIESLAVTPEENKNKTLYSHKEQQQFFREALSLPFSLPVGPFVPQPMYKPHTNSDRRRYVEEVDLEAPIYFWSDNPRECGISLSDALHSRVRRLLLRDETVFEGRGPSVSIRLEWPGYRQWSRQIPTKDFRSPPGPITRAKLAKNVAKCVQRFIAERQSNPLEEEADVRFRVGTGPNHVKLEDLILVSIHHVSMGSWQPHLRLRRPFGP